MNITGQDHTTPVGHIQGSLKFCVLHIPEEEECKRWLFSDEEVVIIGTMYGIYYELRVKHTIGWGNKNVAAQK